ncbi:hypothetical protein ACPA9J_08245 [Pseudomonas aeruginosa]
MDFLLAKVTLLQGQGRAQIRIPADPADPGRIPRRCLDQGRKPTMLVTGERWPATSPTAPC